MKKIEVCLSPDLLHLFDLKGQNVVVVDILRATSCMVTAFAHGIDGIIPVAKLEECKMLQSKGYLAAAERDGLKVEGFDLDNSPFSYMANLSGKTIAVTTTNGTQAIDKSKTANEILIGAFLNINSLANYLRQKTENVVIVCAGWKGNFNLEDTLFAGALISILKKEYEVNQDAAIAACSIYESQQDDLFGFVSQSQHVKRLARLDIIKDIEFCLSFDKYQVVPILQGEKLVLQQELIR
jgi:2-phosphosulfolactate phosphatase